MQRHTVTKPAFLFVVALCICAQCFARGGSERPQPGHDASHNPFKNVRYFHNPEYIAEVEATAQKHPEAAAAIRKVAQYPTALWLDSVRSVGKLAHWLDAARQEQRASGQPTLTVLVLYDLPNRDCAAQASRGELTVADNGEARYRNEFIDPISLQLRAHPEQPVAVILEPDSLANLVTNLGIPKCQEAADVYKNSIAYAIRQLKLKNVSVYLDAGHSCWLGWNGNRERIAQIFAEVLQEAGGPQLVRGFAINTANYNHLRSAHNVVPDPASPCPDELAYAASLSQALEQHNIRNHGFIIDTSRNGGEESRANPGSWCNVRGAGLGERPRAEPAPGIDAYFWIKPPGESDGTSNPAEPRVDEMCAAPDAVKDAPPASQWFESYFLDLVRNASPPL